MFDISGDAMIVISIKLFYTLLLVILIAVLAWEIHQVWKDETVHIGAIDVVDDDGRNTEASSVFPARVIAAQQLLSKHIQDYQENHGLDDVSDTTYLSQNSSKFKAPDAALDRFELNVQNVNLSQLFTVLRNGLRSPDEISGKVISDSGIYVAAMSWPRAPRISDPPSHESANGDSSMVREPEEDVGVENVESSLGPESRSGISPTLQMTSFLTPAGTSLQDSAMLVASSIAWGRASARDEQIASIPREQFCDFALCLHKLYSISALRLNRKSLSDETVDEIRLLAARIERHYESKRLFAELYRLRADILDLIPEDTRLPIEYLDAQEDRIRYTITNSKFSGMTERKKTIHALAEARPALVLDSDGRPKRIPDNWKSLLKRRLDTIQIAALATGSIHLNSDRELNNLDNLVGTGFVIAPGLMATATHVLDIAKENESFVLRLQSGGNTITELPIGKAILSTSTIDANEGADISILKLTNHDPLIHPPLDLFDPKPTPNEFQSRYGYIIGFPAIDRRLPTDSQEVLIGDDEGLKRILPGRILSFGPSEFFPNDKTILTTDISTSGGTSGAPLIDLSTGRLIGVHIGGRFQNVAPPSYRELIPIVKFAYSNDIPDVAIKLVRKAQRGEDLTPVQQDEDEAEGNDAQESPVN